MTASVSESLLMLLSLSACFRLIVGRIVAFDHDLASQQSVTSCNRLSIFAVGCSSKVTSSWDRGADNTARPPTPRYQPVLRAWNGA